jgi:hypothetical protein
VFTVIVVNTTHLIRVAQVAGLIAVVELALIGAGAARASEKQKRKFRNGSDVLTP